MIMLGQLGHGGHVALFQFLPTTPSIAYPQPPCEGVIQYLLSGEPDCSLERNTVADY
jgi:hypothetical protein